MGAGQEFYGDLFYRQHRLQTLDDEPEIVLVEEVRLVDEHENRDRVDGDLRDVVNLRPALASTLGCPDILGLYLLEGIVQFGRRYPCGCLLEYLRSKVKDALNVLRLGGSGEGNWCIPQARQQF